MKIRRWSLWYTDDQNGSFSYSWQKHSLKGASLQAMNTTGRNENNDGHYMHTLSASTHRPERKALLFPSESQREEMGGASPFLSVSESRLLSMAVAVSTATTHISSGLHSSRTLSISDTFSSFKTFAKIIKQSCKDDQKTKQYKISFLTTHSGLQY